MREDPAGPQPERRRVGQGLISGTAWTALHVVVSVPVAFLVNIVVARSLGVVDYGRLAVLTMVVSLATTGASMGVGAALMQFVTKAAERSRHHEVARLVAGAQGYNILIAAPVVAIIVAFVVDAPLQFLILAVVFGIFAPAVLQVGPILLATQHRSDRAAQIAIVSNLVIQLAVVLTVLARPSPEAVWIARIVATGSLMILPFAALSRPLRRASLRPATPWSLPRTFWAFAIPTGLAALVSKLVTERVQVLFLEWLSTSIEVGLFALAFGLAGQILAPVQAAVGPLLPAFAALKDRGATTARDGLQRVTRVSAVATGCVLSLGVPALAALIPWIYGSDYGSSANYFVAMAMSAGVVVVGAGAYASLMSRLKGRSYLAINLCALIVMALLAVVTIPHWGAWGAVASFIGGTLTRALTIVALEVRHYRVPPVETISTFLPVVIALIAVLIVWFGVVSPMDMPPWVAATTGCVLSTLIFVITLRLTGTGLVATDREALLRAFPPRLRPVAVRAIGVVSRGELGRSQ